MSELGSLPPFSLLFLLSSFVARPLFVLAALGALGSVSPLVFSLPAASFARSLLSPFVSAFLALPPFRSLALFCLLVARRRLGVFVGPFALRRLRSRCVAVLARASPPWPGTARLPAPVATVALFAPPSPGPACRRGRRFVGGALFCPRGSETRSRLGAPVAAFRGPPPPTRKYSL